MLPACKKHLLLHSFQKLITRKLSAKKIGVDSNKSAVSCHSTILVGVFKGHKSQSCAHKCPDIGYNPHNCPYYCFFPQLQIQIVRSDLFIIQLFTILVTQKWTIVAIGQINNFSLLSKCPNVILKNWGNIGLVFLTPPPPPSCKSDCHLFWKKTKT